MGGAKRVMGGGKVGGAKRVMGGARWEEPNE